MVALFVLLATSSCKHYEAYEKFNDNIKWAMQHQKPVFTMECPDGGCKFKKLEYYSPLNRPKFEQMNPHPGYELGKTAIKGLVTLGGMKIVADLWEGTVNAAGDSYSHSFNQVGGDNIHTGHVGDGSQIGRDMSSQVFNSYNDDHSTHMPPVEPTEPVPVPEGK